MASQRILASTWHEHITQWRNSGLSLQNYAEQSAIPVKRLGYWARRLSRVELSAPLIPVKLSGVTLAGDIVLRSPSGWVMTLDRHVEPA